MFIGTYDHSLDPKGRYVFPLAEFEAFAVKLRTLPLTERPSRDFVRVFVAGASQESADAQGRVVIPQPLREYAGLAKDVVVVGQLSRIEIWDRSEWERYIPAAQASYSEETNTAHLAELGI